ncbi:hypothetical protein [Chondromyces crocatus]|uniref:Uncharacterized protein n=1 Tax=Chondromyces crocatus TaxID=52 RepID=A0A0K1EP75_CHOCO|nr:hypothetical protein [Chondromyces crocatus]AKT42715.1 uncharacterized protein CMC5_069420 [Chondromyces crocatus]
MRSPRGSGEGGGAGDGLTTEERSSEVRAALARSRGGAGRLGVAAWLGMAALVSACRTTPLVTDETSGAPLVRASAASGAEGDAHAAAVQGAGMRPGAPGGGEAERAVPTFDLEKFAPGGSHPESVFPFDGAVLVTQGLRVGRIVGEEIAWLGMPREVGADIEGRTIVSVHGAWPDAVDVVHTSFRSRVPVPTLSPVTEGGRSLRVGSMGGLGQIVGVARRGSSTLLVAWDVSPQMTARFETVRGPEVRLRSRSPEEAGCDMSEALGARHLSAAVVPIAFGATQQGTLIAFGNLCHQKGPVAEVWDEPGTSRIVDLGPLVGRFERRLEILRGRGDELWLFSGPERPILHYLDGTFSALPLPEKPVQKAFVSQEGKLHVSDGRTILRTSENGWSPVAQLAWPTAFDALAMDKGRIWGAMGGEVHAFRKGESVAYREGCRTLFVPLHVAMHHDPEFFSFAESRQALSRFAGAASLSLVEFQAGGARRLGIQVSSKAQGEALIAHAAATMKGEKPELLCYAPQPIRVIPLKPKANDAGGE